MSLSAAIDHHPTSKKVRYWPQWSKLKVKVFPFLSWLPGVNRETLRADLVAGFTGAAVVLPQGVAFATIAGLPPAYGLYAAMVPAVVAALWGSSKHLVSGPTTAISIVVFSSLSPLAEPGSVEFVKLALTLTFLAGVFQLVMGIAKMGTLVNFISHTVVIGFTAGAAILIASSQIKHFFGVDISRGASFYETMHEFLLHLGSIDWSVASVGFITLAAGIVSRRVVPKFPYMITAMVAGGVAAFGINAVSSDAVKTVGVLAAGLPPLSAPDLSPSTIKVIAGSAFAIAILALTEAVSIGRAVAVRSGQRIDGNQEFIGQGLSNLAGSFFSGYASSGSFNRSGLNYEAGAKTPLAAVSAAGFLVLILLVVAPFAAYLPIPAMAAILFLVAWGLIDFKHIHSILRTSKSESAILVTTFLATLFVELEFAIYIGILMSLMFYLRRTACPVIHSLVPDEADPKRRLVPNHHNVRECSRLKVVGINGPVFFGAINHVEGTLRGFSERHPEQNHILINAKGISFIDIAAAEMLVNEAKRLRALGGGLYFYGLNHEVIKLLNAGGYAEEIGEKNIFASKADAIAVIHKKLGTSATCSKEGKPVFIECQFA